MKDQRLVNDVLKNDSLGNFICSNLKQSLGDIGFSSNLLTDLLANLDNLNVEKFCKKHKQELDIVFTVGFFQDIVPKYFSKQVLPAIEPCDKTIDVGCGTGILANLLSETNKFKNIVGIDINPYPEWKTFSTAYASFQVVREDNFLNFLSTEQPDSISLTWTLHHMEFDEQERYMNYIYDVLKPGARVVILEDAYAEYLPPEEGANHHVAFMKWPVENRQQIMAVQDWLANRVLAQRKKVPMPFGYRTLEEWERMLNKIGFKTISKKYIGFPKERDINNPQSLIVVSR